MQTAKMTRKQRLDAIKVAGYHDDRRTATRLYIEGRLSLPAMQEAFAQGARARAAGVPCSCFECKGAIAERASALLNAASGDRARAISDARVIAADPDTRGATGFWTAVAASLEG